MTYSCTARFELEAHCKRQQLADKQSYDAAISNSTGTTQLRYLPEISLISDSGLHSTKGPLLLKAKGLQSFGAARKALKSALTSKQAVW